MVGAVALLKQEDPDKFEDTIGAIGDTTEEIIECLTQDNVDQF